MEDPLPLESLMKEQPHDCSTRVFSSAATSFAIGTVVGTIRSNWGEIPKVVASRFGPALARTGGVMLRHGLLFAGVGVAYSGIECLSEHFRDKEDWKNGFFGGLAAGSVIGLHLGSLPGAIGAGVAMGSISAVVDASGHSIAGEGMKIDDGAIPKKRMQAPRGM
ncbi:hypothetical protein BSKO_00539 [Bryopsis sp. KO-2023]|nr:hypothetical protein BSKO_00539 [Bryopsis sp. KO-2023]